MPQNWKTYKLTELGTIGRGKSKHRPRDAAHLYGGVYPFIQTGDVKAANHRLNHHNQTYSEAGLAQSKLWPKDIMCITIAANIAETAILNYPACFPDSIIGFIPDKEKVDIDFVEYLMQYFRKQIQSHSIGSVQDNINLATFERIEFKVPPLPEQISIASILSALDDKIELNLAMNRTLEDMAMALYKHWFVDFGPFQNGEFIDSELGMIPKGWEVKRLGDVAILGAGGDKPKIFSKEPTENNVVPIYSNGISNEGLYGFTDRAKVMEEGVTVSARGTIGFVCLRMKPYVPIVRLISLTPRREQISSKYLYIFLKSQDINGTGTTQQQLTVPDFSETKILVPAIELINEFTSIMDTKFISIEANVKENQTLTAMRDTLLPKLISGEVRVKDAEQQLKAVL